LVLFCLSDGSAVIQISLLLEEDCYLVGKWVVAFMIQYSCTVLYLVIFVSVSYKLLFLSEAFG
jgi:hypothetical protein